MHGNLKPCPFCGGQAVMKSSEHNGTTYSSGSCRDWSCPGMVGNLPPQSEAEAARAWNRRATK